MTRTSVELFAAALLYVSIVSRDAGASDSGKCTIATKGDTATGRACAEGGRAAAKKVKKEMVKQAKANGQKFTCDGCHKDLDNYELTRSAVDDFKKLDAAAKIK
jgi:hypothetical protein